MFFEENGLKLNIIAPPVIFKKGADVINKHKEINKEIVFKSSKPLDSKTIEIIKNGKGCINNLNNKEKKDINKNSKKNDIIFKNILDKKDHHNKNYKDVKKSFKNENTNTEMKSSSNIKKRRYKENEKIDDGPPNKKFRKNSFIFDKVEIPIINQSDVKLYKEDVFSKHNFEFLSLHPFMISNLEKLGIKKMTAVQHIVIPHILNGLDVLVKSQTGSGKTNAYAIPIIQKLQSMKPKISRADGIFCIIVVPTRELALQTFSVITSLLRPFVWVVPGFIIGGEKRKSEKARIKKGINIMIATPGRLVDHMDSSANLELSRVQYFVIDEADRMLDMGFEKDIARIVKNLKEKGPKNRQTLLLSATLAPGVEKLAGISMNQPLKIDMTINLKDNDGINNFSTPANLKHFYVIVPTKMRLVTLATFLISKCHFNQKPCKILCFMATQDSVEFHHSLLEASFNLATEDDDDLDIADDSKVSMLKLYGNMDQKDRTKIFNEFHKAKSGILFSTDVAARGLDLAHVDWILQFSCPSSAVEYIHRVGRTARIGACGNGLIFLVPSEADYLHILNENNIQVQEMKIDVILEELIKLNLKRKLDLTHKGVTPHGWKEAASFLQSQFEEKLLHDVGLRTQARKAYNSFIKSYTTYPAALKKIFHIKNLHLGHVATSFAILETPGKVSKVVSKFFKNKTNTGFGYSRERKQLALKSNLKKLNSNFSWMSEFDNGF